jgi:hypothetical protein
VIFLGRNIAGETISLTTQPQASHGFPLTVEIRSLLGAEVSKEILLAASSSIYL